MRLVQHPFVSVRIAQSDIKSVRDRISVVSCRHTEKSKGVG
jgi:hypothetical protein